MAETHAAPLLTVPEGLSEKDQRAAFDEEVAKGLLAMPHLGAILRAASRPRRLSLPPDALAQAERRDANADRQGLGDGSE